MDFFLPLSLSPSKLFMHQICFTMIVFYVKCGVRKSRSLKDQCKDECDLLTDLSINDILGISKISGELHGTSQKLFSLH